MCCQPPTLALPAEAFKHLLVQLFLLQFTHQIWSIHHSLLIAEPEDAILCNAEAMLFRAGAHQ
jgi:hypothetical protein